MNPKITKILRKAKISWLNKDEILLMLTLWNDKMLNVFKEALEEKLTDNVITRKEYDKIMNLMKKWNSDTKLVQEKFTNFTSKANKNCIKDFIDTKDAKLKKEINDINEIEELLNNY